MGMHTSVRWSWTLRAAMRACCVLAFGLAVAGCSDSPTKPAAPPGAPVQMVAVRLEGKVIDADSGEAIPGAKVRFLLGSMANNAQIARADVSTPPGFTDQSGSFRLEWMLPVGWHQLYVGVERDTFLSTQRPVSPTGSVIRMYPERTHPAR